MRKNYLAFLLAVLFTLTSHLHSFGQPPTISYQSVITGLLNPVDLVNAGDGSNRLFVVEQAGLIRMWNGTTLSNFMNLGSGGANIILSGGEQGLLSMAFHPGFDGTSNRYFFVYYTNLSGDIEVSRYQTTAGDPNTGDPSTAQVIMTIPHPGQTNHNGGKLNFGADGHLYFATGDGGGGNDVPNNAQNPASLLGKMIRINVDNFTTPPYYTVPATNPYVGDPSFDPRILNLGLRNPFRWSFDRQTGDMWIGDVGQGAREEINYRPAASLGHNNFGWRCFEGYISTPSVPDCTPVDNVFPVYDYVNGSGAAAVTGGYVYRGNEYTNFRGYYVAADVYLGTLYFLWPNGSGGFDSSEQTGLENFIVGFGEAEDGTLYAVNQALNTVYKLVASGGTALPARLGSLNATAMNGFNELRWHTIGEDGMAWFHIEFSTNPSSFTRVGKLPAGSSAGGNYLFRHPTSGTTTVYYRLAMEDQNGRVSYSSVLRLSNKTSRGFSAYPSPVTNGVLMLSISGAVSRVQIINTTGSVVMDKMMNLSPGTHRLFLPRLASGWYTVVVSHGAERFTRQILVDWR
jgi:glucose/arabinose dehydrogenase